MVRNRGRGRQRPPLERKYGWFRCLSCKVQWQSAHVYCVENTKRVYFKQECKNCKIACNPYKVEDLKCPMCGCPAKECKGRCDQDSKSDYDNDSNEEKMKKPHRADLCLKCRSGWKCIQNLA